MAVQASETRVMGIDPGTLRMGWAVVTVRGSTLRRVASGVLRPPAGHGRPQRLGMLLRSLEALFELHRPDALAIESAFVRRDARAALALGEARGVALAVGASRGLRVLELSPSMIKRSVVGGGRATKAQVQEMVRLAFSLPDLPAEDEADALAAALTYARGLDVVLSVEVATPRRGAVALDPAAPRTAGRDFYASVLAAAGGRRGGR